MRDYKLVGRKLIALVLLVGIMCTSAAAAFAVDSKNPLLCPSKRMEHVATADRFFNILLLGVDFGGEGYRGSGKKSVFEDCHTDSVMVVSVNLDKNNVHLVSIPRDTLTYIPEVKGIYKLNAAINCADTLDEGIKRITGAVEWVMGGIKIDKYCLVDMDGVIALGNAIGGIDFDLEMTYRGRDGRLYKAGNQHLDGQGIMDYLRARKNATKAANDIGRTGRGRKMVSALFQKLSSNLMLVPRALFVVLSGEHHIHTNMSFGDLQQMVQLARSVQGKDIGSSVMQGWLRRALKGWNFHFIDEEHRQKVLKEVYGIEAEPLEYTSMKYATWLEDTGLRQARSIFVAEIVADHLQGVTQMSDEQRQLADDFMAAYDSAIEAFEKAAETLQRKDTGNLEKCVRLMKNAADQVIKAFQLTDPQLSWRTKNAWYCDPLINGYPDVKWY